MNGARIPGESPRVRPKAVRHVVHPWGTLGRVAEWAFRDGKLFYICVGMAMSAALFLSGDVSPQALRHNPADLEASPYGAVRIAEAHRCVPTSRSYYSTISVCRA